MMLDKQSVYKAFDCFEANLSSCKRKVQYIYLYVRSKSLGSHNQANPFDIDAKSKLAGGTEDKMIEVVFQVGTN